ncbi:MAG: response regulator transcription factor [Rubrivivax sp.]|nr:MAG: response regulator transcription factor [Rubrivivax sp.]
MDDAVSVALVEDDACTRARFERVIQADPTLTLVCSAANATDLLAWCSGHPVEVLLVDLGLPDMPGIDLIRRCRRLQPACLVMVITMFGDEANMLLAFEAGAQGYLLKDGTEADLATHVHSLRAGGAPMSPVIARQLLDRWSATRQPQAPAATQIGRAREPVGEALSRRESEVLDLVSRGFTYAEIAANMGVSLSTVHTHVRNIYGKLDVHNRTEAVFEARHLGLIP